MRRFQLTPGIAAFLEVKELPDGVPYSAIYLSEKSGVIVGNRETPLAHMGWPEHLVEVINTHFATVFNLPHEHGSDTPRARYMKELLDMELWIVECAETADEVMKVVGAELSARYPWGYHSDDKEP